MPSSRHIKKHVCTWVVSHADTSKHTYFRVPYISVGREWWNESMYNPGAILLLTAAHWWGCYSNTSDSSRSDCLARMWGRDHRHIDGGIRPTCILLSSVFVSRINWPHWNKNQLIVRRVIFVQIRLPSRHKRQTAVSPVFLTRIKLNSYCQSKSPQKTPGKRSDS